MSDATPSTRFEFSDVAPQAGIVALYTVTMVVGVLLLPGFRQSGIAYHTGGGMGRIGLYMAEILVVTGLMLAVQHFGIGKQAFKLFQYGFFAYVIAVFVATVEANGGGVGALGVATGVLAAAVLWVHHEWYVLDAAGVLLGGIVITVLGVTVTPLFACVLLVAMAAYDAFAVYRSEHMQSVADIGTDLDLPMFFVVPASREFSLRETDPLGDGEVDAALLGLGDAIFPGLLAVSAAYYLDPPAALTAAGVPLGLPTLGVLGGAVLGLLVVQVVLHYWQRMHPALPYINSLTIAGYLGGALAAGVPLATAL